jgi:hypothetical protein
MHVTLNLVSGNRKVGQIPVSTTESGSCPNSCPLASPEGAGTAKGGNCYAAFGPLGMHWRKIGPNGRGGTWSLFCKAIARFASGQLWRHNQAGDLPKLEDSESSDNVDRIDADKCAELSEASAHTKGWTYTHYDPTDPENHAVIKRMNATGGLTVNLSADSVEQADEYYQLGIGPVCVILPQDSPTRGNKTPNGLTIVTCPAQTQEDMSCQKCTLCQVRDRKSVVGFLAHGTAKKRLSEKLESEAV